MNNMKPILTEPGVKYFLKETLKKCKIKKDKQFNNSVNLGLLCIFIGIVSTLLYYKYKTRPTKEDRKKLKHKYEKKKTDFKKKFLKKNPQASIIEKKQALEDYKKKKKMYKL